MTEYPRRRYLTVLDVMTTEVVTVDLFEGFKAVAHKLFDTGVSAMPVVDNDHKVLGLVSEADLLLKEGAEPRAKRRWHKHPGADERKEGAIVAAEIMTEPAITIHADRTVTQAARLMHKRGLKHLPVVDSDDHLVGVVSRHDLIKVFTRSDESIRDEVLHGVLGRDLMIDTQGILVEVEEGVVTIAGEVERRTEIPIIGFLVSAMDGVVAVNNVLTDRWDDTRMDAAIPHGRVAGLFG
jgi:CBS domain-containing protein